MEPLDPLAAALIVGVLGLTVVRQLLRRGPPVWLVFLIGGLLTVPLGILPLPGAAQALLGAAPVILFLLAMFLMVGALEGSGAIEHLAHWFAGRAKRPEDLPLVLFLGFGLLAMVVVNDALVLVGVPVLVALGRRTGVAPRPLLLSLAFAVTVGSVATPIGNPQNLLVASASGLSAPFAEFLRYLFLPTLASLVAGGLFLRWAFRRSAPTSSGRFEAAHAAAPPLFPPGNWRARIVRHPVLWVLPATLAATVTVDVTSSVIGGPAVPIYAIPLGGALLLLGVSGRGRAMGRGVNWTILLLFAGLFLVVAAAVAGGVIAAVATALPIPPPSAGAAALPSITLASLLGPQLFSNVPWVALELPLFHRVGYGAGTPVAWMALTASATLAGNVTILGAASNIILIDRAEQLGEHLTLAEFVRVGLPLTVICVVLVLGGLVFGV